MEVATSIKRQKHESNVCFVDLPDVVYRRIFGLLPDSTVYFRVRLVCKRMNATVREYIQLGGIFIAGSEQNNSTDVIYVFMKNLIPSSIITKKISTFPTQSTKKTIFSS